MAAQFEGPEVAFVSGPVAYEVAGGDGWFVRLQALDFFGVMACGAGGIGSGRPSLANGACVGYRRETFDALGGFSGIAHVTSGDDALLMQKVAYQTPLDVRFCASREALVSTAPLRSVRAFLHHRKRWASQSANYPAPLQRMLAVRAAFFVARVASVVALPFVPDLSLFVLGALALKATGDLSVLIPATRRFGQRRLLAVYPIHLLIHAPQALLAFVLGPVGGFEWKGRQLDQ